MPPHPLDHPQWSSLAGPHAALARRAGQAAIYAADVSPMAGVADQEDDAAWRDLAGLLLDRPAAALMFARPPRLPPSLVALRRFRVPQMIAPLTPIAPPPEPEGLVRLGERDGAEMLALARLTEPGPMAERTVTMGRYWGVRRDGRLVAMAGERLRPTGWVEISGVCTDPAARGRGLARYLVARVTHEAAARGERGFLHVKSGNAAALALYQGLGYAVRCEVEVVVAASASAHAAARAGAGGVH